MAFVTNPLERANAALDSAERRLADFEAESAAKNAALTGDLDFESSLALRDQVSVLERKIAAASDAVIQARRNAMAAKQAEADSETERQYKAAEKSARAAEKVTLEVAAAAEKLRGLLVSLEASRSQVAAANASRGERPAIVDGESRVRSIPDRVIPAVHEERTIWTDGSGRRPSVFREFRGELVPNEGGYTKSRERVEISAESVIRGGIPGGRFKDSIRLIGLKGEALFPAG